MKLLIRDQENIELGREMGEKFGKEVGELSTCVRQVKTNMEQFSASQLASLLGFDQLTIEEISESIKAHPDWSNERLQQNCWKNVISIIRMNREYCFHVPIHSFIS